MRLALALLFLSGLAAPIAAEPLEQAVNQIVSRLASAGLARSATLTFQNLSSLPAAEAEVVRTAAAATLARAGFQVAEGQPEIRLTLSENIHGFLLVAEYNGNVAMAPWARTGSQARKRRHSLKLTPIREQSIPILDFLLSDSGSDLVLLEPYRVVLYRRNGKDWTPGHAVGLNLTRPMPRDPRGRLTGKPEEFRASVPGTLCVGAVAPTPRAGGCKSDGTWVPDRNYFEGPRGAYFTSAPAGSRTMMSHIDRRTRLWSEGPQPAVVVDDWGSDLAPVQNACSPNPTMVRTSPGQNEDTLEAFEVAGDKLISVSDPVRLPGPVTALWPSERGDVSVVVQNRQTGMYEASRVAIACAE